MSTGIDKLASELQKVIEEKDKNKKSPYDTEAEVVRVDSDVVWVKIPGGVDETPAQKTVNAKEGDKVQVRVTGGRAFLVGNGTNPPTDDTVANVAIDNARDANQNATAAGMAAEQAIESANTANEKAYEASIAAAQAQTDAGIAHTAAEEAKADAAAANTAATQAKADAAAASIAAGEAKSAANEAKEDAAAANTAATEAKADAARANTAANDSLSQLSIVEDVVGTLNWITTHATYKASADTEVHAGKWYFTKSGDTYNVVTNPTGNPSAKGYYEVDTIDEAVSNYVASHLALTNEGLYLTKDGNGYKILLANDGLKVYDPEGHLVSTFGESIILDSSRPQTIGNNNVYIKYYDKNNDGTPDSLAIKADEFLLSSGKTIQEELEGVENWFYSVAPTTSNPPASSWTTDKLKEQHLRDIYFDTTSGKSYRWAKEGTTYKWVEIEDVELAALAKDLHDNYPPRSEFTVAPNKIQSTVSAAQTAATNAANTATDNKLKSYYTKTQTDSEISQKANEISLSVAQAEISKIEVGGRNLFGYGSDLQTSLDGLYNLNAGFTIVTEDGIKCAYASGALKTTKYLQSKLSYTPRPSETFTYSCFVKLKNIVRGTTNPMCEFYFSGQTIDGSWKGVSAYKIYVDGEYKGTTIAFDKWITDTKWHHFAVVGTYTNANFTANFQPSIYLRDCTGGLYIHHVKVERGNKATDWTPAPEDLEAYTDSQVSAAKAEIKVTTDGISTEVSKKVGNSEVISKINQSAETVKIQASKVEIDGTATFNAIKAKTDAAYDAKGAASTVQTNLDNLQIGGRNLVWDTEWKNISTRWSNWGSPTTREIITANGKRWLHLVTTASSFQGYSQAQDKRNGYGEIKAGDKVVISYSAYAKTAGQSCAVGCHWRNSSGTIVAQDWFRSYLTTTEKRYTSAVFTIPNDAVGFNIMIGDNSTIAQEIWMSQVKLEFGTKATDWTPAPEDVQAEIDAKKSVHTLDTNYSYTYANILTYSAEGYGGTGGANWTVSSTEGVKPGDTVRLKVTVSDMNNTPVYIIGTVVSVTSATVLKAISHGLDTTVIDGGKILTGSVTANQLAANSITIGDMNQDAKDKVLNSNIQIGGRNLLGHTSNPTIPDINNSNPNATFGHLGAYNSPISEFSLESYDGASNSLVLTSTVTGNRGVGWYTKPGEVKAGETYTFSCRVNASVAVAVHMHTAWKNGSATAGYTGWTSQGSVTLAANTWTDYSFTFEPATNAKLDWEFMVALCFTGNTSGVTCRIAHAKLERGNKVTDWAPAPEDTVNDNILADSKKMAGWKTYALSSISTADVFGVATLTGTTSNWSSNVESLPTISTSILDGTPLWLSFEYTASVDTAILIMLSGSSTAEGSTSSARTKYSRNFGHTYQKTTTWIRSVVKMPTSLSELTDSSGDVNSLFVQFYNRTDNSTFKIRKVKLERGQYASDWTVSKDEYKTYITDIDSQKGITVKPAVKTGNDFLQINSSAVSIYKNNVEVTRLEDASARFGANANPHTTVNSTGLHVWKGAESTATNEVASFGATARIGAKVASSSYIDLEPTAMTLYGTNASNQESPLFKVGNLLNETDEDSFIGDGAKKEFVLTSRFTTGEPPNLIVKVNGTTKTKGTDYSYNYKNNYSYIIFTTAPAALADIRVSYTLSYSTPYLSMGTRKSGTIVKGQSFTIGKDCEASGNYSHAFGVNSAASDYGASADGYNVIASGEYSHAEGNNTTASGDNSHAEGHYTTASMGCSHTEGYHTTASGLDSHAEGYYTTASGNCSHTEGNQTTASGANSHAEGRENIASGDNSHAQGCQTIAQGRCQTAIGKYNLAQGTANSISSTDYALIIGNGTASNYRSNALAVNWQGQVQCRGIGALDGSYGSYKEIYVGNYTSVAKQIFPTLTANSPDSDWLHAAIIGIAQDYPEETWTIFKGRLAPNSDGFFQVCIYNCGEVDSNLTPRYCYGIWTKWWGGLGLFGTDNYEFKYVKIH